MASLQRSDPLSASVAAVVAFLSDPADDAPSVDRTDRLLDADRGRVPESASSVAFTAKHDQRVSILQNTEKILE